MIEDYFNFDAKARANRMWWFLTRKANEAKNPCRTPPT
jgi:hypothetical protein